MSRWAGQIGVVAALIAMGCAVDGHLGSIGGDTNSETTVSDLTTMTADTAGGVGTLDATTDGAEAEREPLFFTSFELDESLPFAQRGEVRIVGRGMSGTDPEFAYSGLLGWRVTLEARGGYVFYYVDAPAQFRAAMYLYVPETYNTYTVVVQKIMYRSSLTFDEVYAFDVNIQPVESGGYKLALYDHRPGQNIGESIQTFPTNQWVKLGVEFVAALTDEGRMNVFLNDELAIGTEPGATFSPDNQAVFGVGAIAQGIEPAPALFYFDDFRVEEVD